jgi:hypothetical protein
MTDLLPHSGAAATAGQRYQPLSLAGVLAAGRAWVLGMLAVTLIVLLAWATADLSGASTEEALRSAGQTWLLAHHGDLAVPGGRVTAAPLGLLLLPGALVASSAARASRAAGVDGLRSATFLVLAITGPYAVLAGAVAALTATAAVVPLPLRCALSAALLAAVSAAVGVVHESGLWARVAGLLPGAVRAVVAGSVAGAATLLGGGALLVAGSLALHAQRSAELTGALAAGAVGTAMLTVLGALLMPNAAVWAAAYAGGPGFAVGTGTLVAPGGVTLGAVPVLPLMAALPGEGPAPAASLGVLLLPVLAGVLAGAVVARRVLALAPEPVAACAAAAGAAAGLLLAGAAWLSGGALGGGRMAVLGPSWWQTGLAVGLELALVAAATGAAACYRLSRGR